MSFYPDIKFSNKLIKNKYSFISYSGYLFKNNSEYVKIVYGFGDDWKHTTEQDMEKTDCGFIAKIKMFDADKINFCFRNSNNEWDNNYSNNFSAPISQIEEHSTFIINEENVLNEILTNLFNADVDVIEETQNDIVEITEEKVQDIEIQNETTSIEPFEIEVIKNEPINIEESLVNSFEVSSLSQDIENIFSENISTENSEKQTLLNDILTSSITEEEFDVEKTIETIETVEEVETQDLVFDMNSLINEILTPIMESSSFQESSSIASEISEVTTETQETDQIVEIESQSQSPIEEIQVEEEPVITNVIENFETTEETYPEEEIFVDKKIDNLLSELFDTVENSINDILPESADETTSNIQEASYDDEDIIEDSVIENIVVQESTESTTENSLEDLFEPEEESLIEEISSDSIKPVETINVEKEQSTTALVEVNDKFVLVSPRSLNKFNQFKKRVKLAVYKFFTAIPKILSANFNENLDK